MPTFPSFPSIDLSDFDLSKIDLSKIDLSKLDLRKLELPKFELPKFDLPKIDLSGVELPKVDLPEVDVDRAAGFARDAAYVGIGLTVLAVEQAQVRRRELQSAIERGVRAVADRVS